MNLLPVVVVLLGVVCFSSTRRGENPRFRRLYDDREILKTRRSNLGEKVGVPLVFDGEKQSFTKTGNMETRSPNKKTTEISEKKESKPTTSDQENDEGSGSADDMGNGKSKEEMGSGYDNIEDMGSGEDNEPSDSENEDESGSGDDLSKSKMDEDLSRKKQHKMPPTKSESGGEVPDLTGEFPPNADQVSKLPKDEDITLEQADKKLADKQKGYSTFTIRQHFKPEYKYKASSAYKILAGNVIHDVERALKATGVVRDVLFREATNVGGPPYRSKVQVYLKLQNVNPKRLKKIVNHGIINGMISVPGSFRAT